MYVVATPRLLAIETEPYRFVAATNRPLAGFATDEESVDARLRIVGMTGKEAMHRLRFCLKWREVLELEAVEPWPSLRLKWKAAGAVDDRTLSPARRWFGDGPSKLELQWEEVIVALFERASELGIRAKLLLGWASLDHVPWEDVDHWPEAHVGDGSYRTAGTNLIVASRDKPSSLEFMFSWLAAGPRQPWKMTTREVALTRDFVYAKFAGGRAARIPLSALRYGWLTNTAHIYEFGRRTRLVLPARVSCPVQQALDARLKS